LERQALHLLFDTPGQKEGMRALLERRKPDFSGS
jgi:1,4-dihydroxy-2-naphthoyl-CoA synthase